MKKFFLTIFLCLSFWGYSQGENDNWYFGGGASVNFSNPNNIVGWSNNTMDAWEACGTVSDNYGNLLFFTNGQDVWDRNNQLMPNGSGLGGYISSSQLAIARNPKNPNQYFVFTTSENHLPLNTFVAYSIIDMSLGNNINGVTMGDVLQNSKTIPVLDNLGNNFYSEAVTIVPNYQNNSYWVLIPNGTHLYSYALDDQGFHNGNPVISDLNFPSQLNVSKYYTIKHSPVVSDSGFSHFICLSYYNNTISQQNENKVYSFDSNSGLITNDYSLEINSMSAYVPEFNKNGSVLFLGYDDIYAVDLLNSTSSTPNFMQIYDDPNNYNNLSIQRNKYGDVYVSRYGLGYLWKILNADTYNSNMSLDLNAIYLGGVAITKYGLPQLIEKASVDITNVCVPDLVLVNPETNNLFTHQASTSITAKNSYTVLSQQNITMKAGEEITLLPDTEIKYGANYIAQIEACSQSFTSKVGNTFSKEMHMRLDLDKKRTNINSQVKIYPNPTSDILNIKTDFKINAVSVVDISGRKVNVKLDGNKVDVRGLSAGTYLINVETKDGISTEKFIKK